MYIVLIDAPLLDTNHTSTLRAPHFEDLSPIEKEAEKKREEFPLLCRPYLNTCLRLPAVSYLKRALTLVRYTTGIDR